MTHDNTPIPLLLRETKASKAERSRIPSKDAISIYTRLAQFHMTQTPQSLMKSLILVYAKTQSPVLNLVKEICTAHEVSRLVNSIHNRFSYTHKKDLLRVLLEVSCQ